jgi:MscS family membrane protein
MRDTLETLWLQNAAGNWLVLLASLLLGLLAGRAAAAVLRRLAQRLEDRGWQGQAVVFRGLAGPASLALLTVGLTVGLAGLKIAPELQAAQAFRVKLLLLLYSISVLWYLYNLIEMVDLALRRFGRPSDSTLERNLAPLVRKTLRIFLVMIGLLFVFESVFNQDIAAWLAGLGIAGLAVSLAAQDSLKNLFGSITILLDQPFHVGERIVTTGCDGVVEEIGFRSTKVRTASGSMVSIPNANLVGNIVENISRQPYIYRNMKLALRRDIEPEKIAAVTEILRGILAGPEIGKPIHANIGGTDRLPRVHFSDIEAERLIFNITYWYAPPNYGDYLEHAEKLNLRICDELTKAGIDFAPHRTAEQSG